VAESHPEAAMNEDVLNMSIRKFLKMVGVNSQRAIEQAVAQAQEAGKLKGDASMPATMTLDIPALGLSVKFDGTINLE
jgi:hypothetical protein